MKRLSLLLLIPVVLFSCEKKSPDATAVCACDEPLIGGLRLSGWDGTDDTADVYVYDAADSFTTATGAMTGKTISGEGIMNFYISADSARDYKIVFRQSGTEYRLQNFSAGTDSAGCSGISGQVHCYSTFSYTLNDSTHTAPKVFDDFLMYDGYKIPVGY